MKIHTLFVILLFFIYGNVQAQYFPPQSEWEEKNPSELGLDAAQLQSAIDSIISFEYSGPIDLRQAILKGFEREPYHKI